MNTELTRQNVAAIQKEIEVALAPLLTKHGLKQTKNRASYDPFTMAVKLEFVVAGAEMARAGARDNSYLMGRFGLKVGDVVNNMSGKTYTITGATERSAKYDFLGKTPDGKSWKVSFRGLKKADGSPVVDLWVQAAIPEAK